VASVRELLDRGNERLHAAASETPRLDAELLLGRAVGVDRTSLIAHPEAPVGADAEARFLADLDRRAAGEPVAYIRGFKEFHGLALAVDGRALVPRPETEVLVAMTEREVVRRLTGSPRPPGTPPIRVADVGTGSGSIAVALGVLLRRRGVGPDVEVLATDDSPAALELARENAVGHGVADRVRFVEADLLPPVVLQPFDVIVANLPYVPSDVVVDRLPVASSFEPRSALDGGPDGLTVIGRLLDRLTDVLAPTGVALLEIGADQAEPIGQLVDERLPGWTCRVEPDLAGYPRTARIERSPAAGDP
jgi:release factor glutamine methyltransferase